jgi:hypothetical protein
MKYRLWSKVSAIFLTFWGLSAGIGWVSLSLKEMDALFISGYMILLLVGQFLVQSLPYILPSVPLWYYGWREDE